SLVFSVAIARALDRYLKVPAVIKWPNDIYLEGKKLTGILLETSGELDAPEYLITGVGINTNIRSDEFPMEMQLFCTSLLEQTRVTVDHNELLAGVLHSMDHYYRRFMQGGFTDVLPEYKEKCFHLGQQVGMMQGNRKVSGINIDINERGHLIVDAGSQMIEITTGDVNLVD
ncbi:MAG: biotin--[acetyl-CoA-carboxylase] ligase, partial [Deltaproteobacteria bacterium]